MTVTNVGTCRTRFRQTLENGALKMLFWGYRRFRLVLVFKIKSYTTEVLITHFRLSPKTLMLGRGQETPQTGQRVLLVCLTNFGRSIEGGAMLLKHPVESLKC